MSDAGQFDNIVAAVLEGRAPEHVRAAAARGALPLPRVQLVQLYVALLGDADESIGGAARISIDNLTPEELRGVLAERSCPREVLVHFAKRATREEALAESIAFHPESPTAAMVVLAAGGNASVIELVMTNQELLLRSPVLLERLMVNPALRADQRGRILELLERVDKLKSDEAAKEAEAGAEALDDEPEDLAELAELLDVDVGELLSASEILGAEELEKSEDPEVRSAFRKIVQMNSAQKAILAMKGGREERLILIRDTNKVVALGVLRNPRISEQEIETIARMRNVTDDVLRQLARNRDWVKKYIVIKELVQNPRTPQTVSANFIPRMTNRDLRELARSREVPELIRRMAKRTFDTRTQKRAGAFKKH